VHSHFGCVLAAIVRKSLENSFDRVKLIEPLNNAILRRASLRHETGRHVIFEAIRRFLLFSYSFTEAKNNHNSTLLSLLNYARVKSYQ